MHELLHRRSAAPNPTSTSSSPVREALPFFLVKGSGGELLLVRVHGEEQGAERGGSAAVACDWQRGGSTAAAATKQPWPGAADATKERAVGGVLRFEERAMLGEDFCVGCW